MPFEVYTGAKPARPRLALIVSAGLLAATLALAWHQAYRKSALGPEQRVGDTPLLIRPPIGWHVDPQDPQAFILPVREEGWRQKVFRFERRIRFEYERLPSFRSAEQLLHYKRLDRPETLATVQPARIGPFPAVEVRKLVPIQITRKERFFRERIVRLTCLPRGHLITIEYDPLTDLRPADLQIMDEVCHTLRVDDPTISGPPDQFLQQAGLNLTLDPDWNVTWSDFPEVPGVYIGGSEDGAAAWSIGIFRTWLAAGRTPADLLVDFAADFWLAWDVTDSIRHSRRQADEVQITSLSGARIGAQDSPLASVWVVRRTAVQCVMMYVHTDSHHAAAAHAVADRIAADLDILPLESLPALGPAEQAGRTLAARLRERGAVPRWGRVHTRTTYHGRTIRGPAEVRSQRQALGHNAENGYEGLTVLRSESRHEKTAWTVGGRAQTYEFSADFFFGATQVSLRERRPGPNADVTRDVTADDGRRRRWSFKPGPAFVPPPTETIIEGWVARHEVPAAIVEFSTILGPATHSVLLRALPADDEYRRVLAQQDYWPLGLIAAYDDQRAELVYQRSPTAYLERVPRDRPTRPDSE